MTKTIIKEQQELTEFGYMARAREVVTESCKCSYLQQELQKTRERLEKAESILKVSVDINISGWQTYRMANQYFKDKDKQGE